MSEYKDYGWNSSEPTLAHSYILKKLIPLLPIDGSSILDIGCGNGATANYLIKNGYDVYGTDASVKGIDIAKKGNNDRFFVQDLSKDYLPIELQNIQFKTIISTEVVEHLYDPRKYIDFCKTILLKSGGGTLILTTPYHGYLKNIGLSITGAMDKHFTVLWDGGHIKFWSYKTLKQLLNEFGFEVTNFKGCGRFPYLWKSMLLSAKIEK